MDSGHAFAFFPRSALALKLQAVAVCHASTLQDPTLDMDRSEQHRVMSHALCGEHVFTDSAVQVCAAACACIQSLSGSMKCLRELPMAQLTPSMLRLLSHDQPEIQLTAVKALTNLLLDADTAKVTFVVLI